MRCGRAGYFSAGLLLILLGLPGCGPREGIKTTPQMDLRADLWVNVLLFEDVTACELKVDCPFTVIETQKTKAVFEESAAIRKISFLDNKISIGRRQFGCEQLLICPGKPHIFNLNSNDYRGKLKIVPDCDNGTFDLINIVPPEPYLAGVIGAEMPAYWESAALKAQTIAARTYCFYIKRRFGRNRQWDVKKTAASQVYLGVKAESRKIWQIVNQTEGDVLFCKQNGGQSDIFPAYYSSTCGGHTENSKNVFGDSFEPLAGVSCPYCKLTAKPKFFFWSVVKFNKTYVTDRLLKRFPKLKKLGSIKNITTAKKSDYGQFSRLTMLKLHGTTGKTDWIRAEDFRLTVDPSGHKLKSTSFRIVSMSDKWGFFSGRGFGHGVGMCQCGTEAMARKAMTAEQILSYYYPGAEIVKLY